MACCRSCELGGPCEGAMPHPCDALGTPCSDEVMSRGLGGVATDPYSYQIPRWQISAAPDRPQWVVGLDVPRSVRETGERRERERISRVEEGRAGVVDCLDWALLALLIGMVSGGAGAWWLLR